LRDAPCLCDSGRIGEVHLHFHSFPVNLSVLRGLLVGLYDACYAQALEDTRQYYEKEQVRLADENTDLRVEIETLKLNQPDPSPTPPTEAT